MASAQGRFGRRADLGNLRVRRVAAANGDTYRTPSGSIGHTASATYDGLGNRYLDSTSRYDDYGSGLDDCSGGANLGPGALTRSGTNQYCYDAHGNRTRVMDRANNAALQKQSILYNAYDKAREIRFRSDDSPTPTGHTTDYRYGPERQMFRRTDWNGNVPSGAGESTEYVGTTEILRPSGATYRDIRRVGRSLSFDGPSPGLAYSQGRIFGVRWKGGKFGARLDLHSLRIGGPPVLHINYGSSAAGENNHIKLWTFGGD